MATKKKKFGWEKGDKLDPDDYEPVGGVRDIGFIKLADGVYADPALRKEARKAKLTSRARKKPDEFFTEESSTGIHSELSNSEASRLIHKDKEKIKGIIRFQKASQKQK